MTASDADKRALYARFLNFQPRKGDLKRMEILETTLEILGTEGVERLSFERIAKKIGSNRAHVAYYFKSRDALVRDALRLVVTNAQGTIIEAVKQATTPEAQLMAFLGANFEWAEKFPLHASATLLLYYQSSYSEEVRKFNDEVRSFGAKRIAALLAEMRPDLAQAKRMDLAKLIQNLITGHLIDYFTTDNRHSLSLLGKKTQTQCETLIQHFN